jgi:hypothetical protein
LPAHRTHGSLHALLKQMLRHGAVHTPWRQQL